MRRSARNGVGFPVESSEPEASGFDVAVAEIASVLRGAETVATRSPVLVGLLVAACAVLSLVPLVVLFGEY